MRAWREPWQPSAQRRVPRLLLARALPLSQRRAYPQLLRRALELPPQALELRRQEPPRLRAWPKQLASAQTRQQKKS